MRRRGAIVEHPFGTLKCRAGYRHFLVRGEWSLMALCYNLSRVLTIVGFAALVGYFAKRAAALSLLFLPIRRSAAVARSGCAQSRSGDFRPRSTENPLTPIRS